MVRCVDRLTVSPLCVKDDKCSVAGSLQTIVKLLENTQFQKLLNIHNIIQSVQCFQCPPAPLCCDAKILVREVSDYIIFSSSAFSKVLNRGYWFVRENTVTKASRHSQHYPVGSVLSMSSRATVLRCQNPRS